MVLLFASIMVHEDWKGITMSKQIYKMCLDDCSTPGFVSFTKDYFGTIEDVEGLVTAIRDDELRPDDYLASILDRYKSGEKDVTNNAAYKERPFLLRARCIEKRTSFLYQYRWEHVNVWNCPYEMKCSKAESTHIWITCHRKFYRCIKTTFTNLRYESIGGKYKTINMLWGYPHQIEFNKNTLYNRMYVVEKTFKTRAELLKDIENFELNPDPVFTEVLNDIFGDG